MASIMTDESQNGEEMPADENSFTLTITRDSIDSTDGRFTLDNLGLGDNYKPLDAYFEDENGHKVVRKREKNEQRISNQTLPRIAFQVFENEIVGLSEDERKDFLICQYGKMGEPIRGIYSSFEEFEETRSSWQFSNYKFRRDGEELQYVIYSWNVFSTLLFVQTCLRKFGKAGDKFVLVYREKNNREKNIDEPDGSGNKGSADEVETIQRYSDILQESKNIILRGAPGTGKTFLAKRIAAYLVSNGERIGIEELSEEQRRQIGFVQFHPSYDYSDFVEGLRPVVNADGSMGFELADGVFKKFVDRAAKNVEDSRKAVAVIEKEARAQESLASFLEDIEFEENTFKTKNGNEFTITGVDDRYVYVFIPGNVNAKSLRLEVNELLATLSSDEEFTEVKDLYAFFGRSHRAHEDSYVFALYKAIKNRDSAVDDVKIKPEKLKNYVFIIDEINRGEISKVFGELFFAIDPDYRGLKGGVSTQYANMHTNPDDRFYIPSNVFIIGTMNDIDRSVDTFDFAMRRRFRFVELKANDGLYILDSLGDDKREDAKKRMRLLNEAIADVDDLNENYQIGAAYFLKLQSLEFDQLWDDHLCPLLREYVQGMYDERGIMERFESAYFGYGLVDPDDSVRD